MLSQIVLLLVDTVVAFFVYLLLARFHFQWLRVPFRNPVGEFVVATTNWIVAPARRVIPTLAGLDLATLVAAWVAQAAGLWAVAALAGADGAPGLALVPLLAAAVADLLRYSLYILSVAVIVQAVMSWVNPYAPLAPVFDALTPPRAWPETAPWSGPVVWVAARPCRANPRGGGGGVEGCGVSGGARDQAAR